jgi:hypothetical protein
VRGSDLEHGRADQLAAVADRKRACDKRRERDAYESSCVAMITHVESGSLSPADPAGAQRALLERVAKKSLDASDLAKDPELPCADVEGSPRLWAAFVKAAAASTNAWRTAGAISPKLANTLRTKGPPLASDALVALNDRAEVTARKGLLSGDDATLGEAKQLCGLENAIGLEQGSGCKRLSVVLSGLRR